MWCPCSFLFFCFDIFSDLLQSFQYKFLDCSHLIIIFLPSTPWLQRMMTDSHVIKSTSYLSFVFIYFSGQKMNAFFTTLHWYWCGIVSHLTIHSLFMLKTTRQSSSKRLDRGYFENNICGCIVLWFTCQMVVFLYNWRNLHVFPLLHFCKNSDTFTGEIYLWNHAISLDELFRVFKQESTQNCLISTWTNSDWIFRLKLTRLSFSALLFIFSDPKHWNWMPWNMS